MAVNPEGANPTRVVSPSDGTNFQLDVKGSRGRGLVFLDSGRTGPAMITGIVKANTLDSLAPLKAEGEANLGTMTIASGSASMSISYDALLAALNLTSAGADFLGAIDDMSLRYANPDIDGNGVIDEL